MVNPPNEVKLSNKRLKRWLMRELGYLPWYWRDYKPQPLWFWEWNNG